jgi:hypothetical protein
MTKDRAHWADDETRLLLTLALQEKEKFNFNHQGLTNVGWSNVYTYFPIMIRNNATTNWAP